MAMLEKEELGRAIKIAIDRKIASGSIKSQAEVARHFGVKPPSVTDWIKRGTISKSKLSELIAYFADVVPFSHWGVEIPNTFHVQKMDRASDEVKGGINIPILSNTGSMGPGQLLEDGDIAIGALTVSQGWIDKNLPHVSRASNLCFIHGCGDSMAPTFHDGDILLVDSGIKLADIDGVYVLLSRGELFIKRVSRRLDGTKIITSDNPSVKTSDVLNGAHKVEIKGRVLWVWNGKRL